MAQGKFNGVSDEVWAIISQSLPNNDTYVGKKGGMPPCDFRRVINSIFWVCITGSGWCQVPENETFAPKTTANRWMTRWGQDKTLENLARSMTQIADLNNMIDWKKAFVDGSFSPGTGRRWR
jgi:transposase